MISLGQFLYMAEAEGVTDIVNTEEAKINAVINDLVNLVNRGINPEGFFNDVCIDNGLSHVSDKTIDRICKAVTKRTGYVTR